MRIRNKNESSEDEKSGEESGDEKKEKKKKKDKKAKAEKKKQGLREKRITPILQKELLKYLVYNAQNDPALVVREITAK